MTLFLRQSIHKNLETGTAYVTWVSNRVAPLYIYNGLNHEIRVSKYDNGTI